MDALHVDCLIFHSEVHMWRAYSWVSGDTPRDRLHHATHTLGIVAFAHHSLDGRYACAVICYYGRWLYAQHSFLNHWAFVLYARSSL